MIVNVISVTQASKISFEKRFRVVQVSGGVTIQNKKSFCIVVNQGAKGDPGIPTLNALESLMATIPEYPNKDAAIAGGLSSDDLFFYSQDSDEGVPGNLCKIP